VLEVTPVRAAMIHCLASGPALDQVGQATGAGAVRIAQDETLVLAPPGAATAVVEKLLAATRPLDPACLVVDQSSGYSGFRLSGGREVEAFARLSQLPLDGRRPAFLQGLVARSSAKVLVDDDSITFFVSSIVDEFVRNRIGAACADLDPTWQPAAEFVVSTSTEGRP
jgi:hypothetical protein